MQDIQTALKNFTEALQKLEDRLPERMAKAAQAKSELESLTIEAAHMRSEISALKKQISAGASAQGKAEQQIDAAMKQLDELMNGAGEHG
ncbi:hypothetical protein IMCC14465_12360 [alpha proteobacterium IMCC14465]|uniref:Uncharacterized protein n=1 Tax=alpha proteobacterium IMCC14465 TaxID=1220535 RepID=J9A4Y4_9PROT|nr:hypothetical protein IMCC14465_12360 [alpha proteobacterium IMCC14465]